MKFSELVKNRQSVRNFKSTPISREIIDRCLESARLAPSACNSQPWHFVVVDDPEIKDKMVVHIKNKMLKLNLFAEQPPVYVVVVTESSNFTASLGNIVKNKAYNLVDVGIATEHLCLQAVEEGLGSCIIGWFDESKIQKLLNIPKSKRLHVIVALGYVADNYQLRNKVRKAITEIRTYNKYR